jgi:hypothetical protein
MSEEKPSQSMNFSGSQLSGVNAAQDIGGNVNLTLSNTQGEAEKQLTSIEVVELIAQIEALFRSSDLPEEQKEKALKHLDTANALLSVSENHAQSKSLRAFPHNDLSGEFLSETQKCRPIGKTHTLSGLQRL